MDTRWLRLALQLKLTVFQFAKMDVSRRVGCVADKNLTRSGLRGEAGGDVDVIAESREIRRAALVADHTDKGGPCMNTDSYRQPGSLRIAMTCLSQQILCGLDRFT